MANQIVKVDGNTTIKLWKGNRLDGEFEISLGEIASGFLKSQECEKYKKYADRMPLSRYIYTYIGSPDGLNCSTEMKPGDPNYMGSDGINFRTLKMLVLQDLGE